MSCFLLVVVTLACLWCYGDVEPNPVPGVRRRDTVLNIRGLHSSLASLPVDVSELDFLFCAEIQVHIVGISLSFVFLVLAFLTKGRIPLQGPDFRNFLQIS